jgi:hypothetical protein
MIDTFKIKTESLADLLTGFGVHAIEVDGNIFTFDSNTNILFVKKNIEKYLAADTEIFVHYHKK